MPVETASQADIGYQDELWIGPVGTGTVVTQWTQILGVKEVSHPDRIPEEKDATHMQSPGFTKEYIAGMLDAADFSQEMDFFSEDPGQLLLDALAALHETFPRIGEDVYFEMSVGGRRRTYRGNVRAFTVMSTVGEIRKAALKARLFERQTTNPRTVAP